MKLQNVRLILKEKEEKKVPEVRISYFNENFNKNGSQKRQTIFNYMDTKFLIEIIDTIMKFSELLETNQYSLFKISKIKFVQSGFNCYSTIIEASIQNSSYLEKGLSQEKIRKMNMDLYNYLVSMKKERSEKKKPDYSEIKSKKEELDLNENNCTITYKYEFPTNVHIGSENKMEEEPIQENSSKNKMEEKPIQENSSENKMEEEPIQENSSENKSENKMEEESLNLNNFVPSKSSLKKVKGPNKKKSESLGSVSEEDDEFRIC